MKNISKSMQESLVEAAKAKRENWYGASTAHNVVRDHWGELLAHPDPEVRVRMKKIEDATTELVDYLVERTEVGALGYAARGKFGLYLQRRSQTGSEWGDLQFAYVFATRGEAERQVPDCEVSEVDRAPSGRSLSDPVDGRDHG